MNKVLKGYLFFASIYLLLDGLVHLFDIKLIGINNWPTQPFIYSQFIGHLYGGFAILTALLGLEVQRDIKKYKNFLYIVAVWGFFYGLYLVYSSLTTDFLATFKDTPSIYVWIPFYNGYLLFEAALLYTMSGLTYLYWKSESNKVKNANN